MSSALNFTCAAITATVHMRTKSANGSHGSWRAHAMQRKRERKAAWTALIAATGWSLAHDAGVDLPVVVTLTRVASRALDDDNWVGAAKAVRDGVADWLHVNDNDPRVTWRYDQRKGAQGEYAVEIRLEARR